MRKFETVLALTFALMLFSSVSGIEEASLNQRGRAEELRTTGAIHGRSIQASVPDCVWNGVSCSLRRDFVNGLPGVLGSPTTESAKILADAALRAAVCSNFTGKSECLNGASYNCDWDTVLNRCTLADLLNATMLRGLAFCPGSPLDLAMSCFSQPVASCGSSPGLNCTLIDGVPLAGPLSDLAGAGDRQLSTMMGSMMGTLVKYGMAGMADPMQDLLSGLLGASGAASSVTVCGAAWMVESASLTNLGGILSDALKANRDLLSAILGSNLAGSCNGTLPLLAAATACQAATPGGPSACAATRGCQWLGAAAACTLGPDALPALALDPSDRWVTVLSNATAICRSMTDAGSCGGANNIAIALEKGRGGGGGSSSGGGAGAPAAASWWLLAAAAAAAMALGDAARRV